MPHYKMLMNNRRNKGKPIIYADLDINPSNKEFIQSMEIVGMPTFQFYCGNGTLVDQFLCGPKNVRRLKDKVNKFITRFVDSKTNTIRRLGYEDEGHIEETASTMSSSEEEPELATT